MSGSTLDHAALDTVAEALACLGGVDAAYREGKAALEAGEDADESVMRTFEGCQRNAVDLILQIREHGCDVTRLRRRHKRWWR